eukprot:3293181-Amphidinium_carterae.1
MVAHAHLWHELWTAHPAPISCTKVAAHASWKSVVGDPARELQWLGNFMADRYDKWGAYENPGGKQQFRKCEQWELHLHVLYEFMASQAEQLARRRTWTVTTSRSVGLGQLASVPGP